MHVKLPDHSLRGTQMQLVSEVHSSFYGWVMRDRMLKGLVQRVDFHQCDTA